MRGNGGEDGENTTKWAGANSRRKKNLRPLTFHLGPHFAVLGAISSRGQRYGSSYTSSELLCDL